MTRAFAIACVAIVLAAPLAARDSLGIYDSWGAFRDGNVPRCFAIAKPQASRARKDYSAFASIGTWPQRQIRNQLHFRLSRKLATRPSVRLRVIGRSFELTGGGGDAWAQDKSMDAAIVAAMRSAGSMSISATDARGNRFTDRYALTGAATAIDAATVGCSARQR